jgi:hypothetical protein
MRRRCRDSGPSLELRRPGRIDFIERDRHHLAEVCQRLCDCSAPLAMDDAGMRRNIVCVFLAGLALTACSSNYIPQSRGRVAVTMEMGTPTYVRDGVKYPHGFLGSGLIDSVAGNRSAEQAAHEYRNRLGTGILVGLIGTVCVPVAFAFALKSANDTRSNDIRPALWVALGCTVVMGAGFGYAATAEPYRWDAINIFNDTTPPPFFGPPSAQLVPTLRKATLQMRR